LALHRDLIVEPLAIRAGRLLHDRIFQTSSRRFLAWRKHQHIRHPIQAAGFPRILVRGIHLALVALRRPALVLELGVEIDSAVGIRQRLDLELQLEVLELRLAVRADVKQMRAPAAHLQRSILHRKAARHFLVRLPAAQVLAIENRNKPVPGHRRRHQHADGQRHPISEPFHP